MPNAFPIAAGPSYFWEGVVECDLPCARAYARFPCVCYFPACAKRVALFSERESLGATCLAQDILHVFLVFSTPRPVQSGSRSFSLLGATCLAQGGSRSFFWEEVASATCLALGGSHFFSGWPDYLPFWIPFGVAGLKFRGKRP